MKNANSTAGLPSRRSTWMHFGLKTLVPLASVTVLLTACGGGGSSDGGDGSSTGGGVTAPTPILQVGMQRVYSGATSRSVVYANPTGTQQNNTLGYNFTETINVLQAAGNTGASFDVQSTYTYAITQDPGTGMVPVSQTVDSYQNLLTNGVSQNTVTVGQTTTMVQSDETANALGTGPYLATTRSSFSYPTPIPGMSFPLQNGATLALPMGEIVNTSYQDVNASGSGPSNGSNVAYTSQSTKNNDGSYTTAISRANGVTLVDTVNPDGSASISSSGGSTAYTATIGVPVPTSNGAFTIPVNYAFTLPSVSNNSYAAGDWYPGLALPTTPLASQVKTVVGPVTTLPNECSGALAQPNMFEIDTTETSLSTLGSYLTSTTRAINANGVVVCSLQEQVSTSYNIQTGALISTTTTDTTNWLSSLNY